jgi:thiol-disulfide isomerase/thioredoxin
LSGCPASRAAREPVADPRAGDQVVAVLVNGGARKELNYQSHLEHVRSVVKLLGENGVPPEHIAIFSGDGQDPAADLATRALNPRPEFWLLPGSGPGGALRPRVHYIDSQVQGFTLHPAKRDQLRKWFETEGAKLGPGQTLLFYVTDHGERSKDDQTNNTITLWGENLSVTELRELFHHVDPRVRIVMLMSQCFSGSFANTIYADPKNDKPQENICGYFASTADRPAYGCYPENRGKDGVGHSFHLLEAAEVLGSLPESQLRTLVTDDSPDVPHTTGNFYLHRLIEKYAKSQNREPSEVADELIASAWQHKGDWEPEIRLLDRIGQTFGFVSPRSLSELQKQAEVLPQVSTQLRTYADRWQEALDSLTQENLRRFLDQSSKWKEHLTPERLKALNEDERAQLADDLLTDLIPYTEDQKETFARLELLHQRAEEAHQAAYRMEVRLGVVLRMRAILEEVAGREYLAQHATPEERQSYEAMRACENLWLDKTPRVASAAALPAPEQFPSLGADRLVVNDVMPAWMGIRYRPLEKAEHDLEGTAIGAVGVITVSPGSPAETAGLKVGDVILGASGKRFVEPNQVREWTMRSEIGEEYPLDVQRDKKVLHLALRPQPYPIEMPALPGPPDVGSAAPPVKVQVVRGDTDLEKPRPRLLFFWATWCMPCKASVPELLAFGKERGIDVVAITDEPAEIVEKFLQEHKEPFPTIVASDRFRVTFQNYGVSGTPTFVLIDEKGIVQHYKTGYAPNLGLGIDGWQWKQPKKKA